VTIAREPPNVVAINGVAYKVEFSLTDNLKLFVGKRINVTLASGSSFEGTVKEVGQNLLHIEKLNEKDFNDALVRIDSIVAIDTKFWAFKK
jgi:small nuclear ribonucleoprotein (snRNP)-like protein